MALNAPVGLSGEDCQKCSFNLSAKATNLNRHGGAVRLKRELSVGSTVVLRNNRGAKVSARVVTQVSAVEGVNTYGIEFVEGEGPARNFWGITFSTS
jgi:hypothetical protein